MGVPGHKRGLWWRKGLRTTVLWHTAVFQHISSCSAPQRQNKTKSTVKRQIWFTLERQQSNMNAQKRSWTAYFLLLPLIAVKGSLKELDSSIHLLLRYRLEFQGYCLQTQVKHYGSPTRRGKKPFKLLHLTWNHCCLCHLNLNFKRAKCTKLHAFFYTADLYVLGGCTLLSSNPYPPILLFLLLLNQRQRILQDRSELMLQHKNVSLDFISELINPKIICLGWIHMLCLT